MNFQATPVKPPIRVLVTNPLTPTAQMTITKMMAGMLFGKNQPIDLILLVYSNEVPSAEIYKREIKTCGFVCLNSIQISSVLPNYTDADVFVFITTLKNPNKIDYYGIDNDEFDALYLIIKLANNLKRSKPSEETEKNKAEAAKEARHAFIVTDGLIALDIISSLSQNLPKTHFFCPTSLTTIAKQILAENLKAYCKDINDILVWGASDEDFHIEALKPYVLHDVVDKGDSCDWDAVSKERLKALDLDHTQFNESWMKKEYINLIKERAVNNPYGSIYRSIEMCKTLNLVWSSHFDQPYYNRCSLGVISDGTLGTIKGGAYIQPLKLIGDRWVIDRSFELSIHLRFEIKSINKVVQANHERLLIYCKKFFHDNIVNQAFIPSDHDTLSVCTNAGQSSRTSVTRTIT